jgi:hypothetical protein
MVERQIRKALQIFHRVPLHMSSVIACLNAGFWTQWLR